MRGGGQRKQSNETNADVGDTSIAPSAARANRYALFIFYFLFLRIYQRKERDEVEIVTYVAPIKFCIPCILDCQGIESSVGGTDDDGVLSAVLNTRRRGGRQYYSCHDSLWKEQ